MRRTLACMLLAVAATVASAAAQPALTFGTVSRTELSALVPINITGAPTSNVPAIQFSFSTPAAPATLAVTIGPTMVTAEKTLVCSQNAVRTMCVIYGVNINLIPDGVLVNVSLTSTSAQSVTTSIADLLAASL